MLGEPWPEELVDVKIADRMHISLGELRRTPMPDVLKYVITMNGESQHADELKRQAERDAN